MNTETALIPRTTLTQMADAYIEAEKEINAAYAMLDAARGRLKLAFNQDGYRFGFRIGIHSHEYEDPAKLMFEVRKDVWKSILGRMEVRNIMSIAEADKMDKQLESGKDMPDITAANLIAMLDGVIQRVPEMMADAVKEVFDWLMPYNWRRDDEYKTNLKNEFGLGHKVIKGYCIEIGYNGFFRASYSHDQKLRCLDNVFHLLDGKGIVKEQYGPLITAINATKISDGVCETEYFKCKLYGNRNIHIEFKRLDLVERLNQVAGGMRINAPRSAT